MPAAADDRELVTRFQKGEEGAFNELVRRYQKPIYLIARRLVRTHQAAEDVTQDIFIKAYQKLRDFRGEASFYTWIYRIAVNLSLNARRKQRIRQVLSLEAVGLSLASQGPGPDQQTENDETLEAIHQAIDYLPAKQKIVFTLRYEHNLPHAEIARILGRDEGTIKANYHHAIRKLRKAVTS